VSVFEVSAFLLDHALRPGLTEALSGHLGKYSVAHHRFDHLSCDIFSLPCSFAGEGFFLGLRSIALIGFNAAMRLYALSFVWLNAAMRLNALSFVWLNAAMRLNALSFV
jgi:hypothetical protein